MAGVAKVVDGLKDDNGKVTKSYYEMKEAMLDMSGNLPMTAENIAEIMEAAGQSNIAKEELLDFTESATKMGIAFDSTAEQAGEWMAAWRTALDLDQSQVTVLADQVNYLGNTTSESAIKISEVITEIGSLSKTAGISASSVAAIAASMTKVDSNVAATGIKNLSLALVSGESATKRQVNAYKTIGLEAKKVAKSMQVDSQGTIIDVLERINKLDKTSQTSTLKNLFGSESLASIAPLAANLDNLKEQFKKVGDAALYAGSMEQEYIAASSTAANVDVLTENKIQRMKIKAGDALIPLSVLAAETKGKIADSISSFRDKNAPDINNTIENISETIQRYIPTAVRNIKNFASSGKEFIKGFSPVFNLISDNPKLIPNFIISIGTAMVTYKVANNLGNIVKNVKAAGSPLKVLSGIITNPWALAIGATAGAIAMIAKSIGDAKQKLVSADLASRFGDISLSLEELDEIAAGIIKNDNMSQIAESLKLTENINSITNTIDEAVEEINKYNWKIGIGLELTENEIEQYKEHIANFINESKNLALENRYKAEINMDLFTDGSIEGNAIQEKMKEFYDNNYEKISSIGEDFQRDFNAAFSDGLLDFDVTEVVNNYMKKMSEANALIAESQFESKMIALGIEYSGTELTKESFTNLQAEIGEQLKENKKKATELLANTINEYKIANKSGALSDEEYDNAVKMAKKEYLTSTSEDEARAISFQLQTIMDAYGEEIKSATPELQSTIEELIKNFTNAANNGFNNTDMSINWTDLFKDEAFGSLSETTRSALEELFKELQPSVDSLNQTKEKFKEYGIEIPESITQALTDTAVLGSMAKDSDSMWMLISEKVISSEEYTNAIIKAQEAGINIPEEIAKVIDENKEVVNAPISSLYAHTKQYIEQTFGSGINIPLNVNSLYSLKTGISSGIPTNDKLPGHADGGIFSKPHVAWFAEKGPEAAVPLDGSKNAIKIWYMAGQLLGMFDREDSKSEVSLPDVYNKLVNASSINNNFNNSPSIKVEYKVTVESGAEQEKVNKAITMSQSQFNQMMQIYEKNNLRVKMG